MLRRGSRVTALLTLGATVASFALWAPPPGAGATPPPDSTERVSVDVDGADADNLSMYPVISADGGVVLFNSTATDLVDGPGALSYLRDLTTGVTTALPLGQDVGHPSLTGDGSKVVFDSARADLVPGDTNGRRDVFVHDVAAGTTTRVSVDSAGAQFPAGTSTSAGISTDGRYVAFVTRTVQTASCQNDRVSVRDLTTGQTRVVQRCVLDARLSGDASAVLAMSAGPEGCGYALNVVQRTSGVSAPTGCGVDAVISGNGDVVAFASLSATASIRGMIAVDVATGIAERVDVADDGTPGNGVYGLVDAGPVINGNGRLVAFASTATNLVPGDGSTADVFVRDLAAGTTRMVSVATDGTPGSGESLRPAISGDGSILAFHSRATDLVPGDGNGQIDVFARHLVPSVCASATNAVVGTYGADWLRGTTGPDVFVGLAGDDTFNGLAGDDVLCGGSGSDTATYLDAPAAVEVDLALATATGQGADTFLSVEGVEGSRFNDKLRGTAGPDRFLGLAGADAISGLGGDDLLDGGAGNDKLYGYAGRDALLGGDGNDLLSGGAGVDSLDGGAGADTCGGDPTDAPVTGCEG
ncbi:hypothetical protein [Nocardioides sp. SR21]|uniref:hypothetical protein n=1 Tax=Nocardioides sp. SR21 TaxID=2919501 RepID=UPI00242DFCC3|nr:hypothetical protein [Nocardioides sp. SR21]